jgi:hypothetical protein
MTAVNTMVEAMTESIYAAHQATFTEGPPAAVATSFTNEEPVYRAAKQACARLGFIDIDAECLALAWQAQTQRLGASMPRPGPHRRLTSAWRHGHAVKALPLARASWACTPCCPMPNGWPAWPGRRAHAAAALQVNRC